MLLLSVLLFWWVQEHDHALHRWNRILADASLLMLCVTLAIGPVARFVPAGRRLVPWRRELGFGMFVAAGLHVAIYLAGLDRRWNPFDLVIGRDGRTGDLMLLEGQDAAANWVGLMALSYALVLAATSNRFAQRRLGRGWKFVQQQAYTLFVLAMLHTAGWLYLSYDQPTRFRWWFWALVGSTAVAQFAGFVQTIRKARIRTREPKPAAARSRGHMDRFGVAKAVAVVILWGGLIVGIYQTAINAHDEDAVQPTGFEPVAADKIISG